METTSRNVTVGSEAEAPAGQTTASNPEPAASDGIRPGDQATDDEDVEEITQWEAARRTVRAYTMMGAGVGIVPFPLVDLAGILALQLKLIAELSKIYEVEFFEHKVRNLVASLFGSFGAGLTVVPALASAAKLIPGVGTAASSLAMPVITGGATYAVGQVFIMHFESGGTLLNFDPDKMHEYFAQQYEKGRKVATDVAKNSKESEN